MKLDPIADSSVVSGASYDAGTQTMTLRYKNGNYYNHSNVDPKKYADFQASPSKGKWLHANLGGKNAKDHSFTKIPPPAEDQ